MVMTCEKQSLSKKDAQAILNHIKENRGKKHFRGRKEQRMYQCDHCNSYHLTSMDEETFEMKKQQEKFEPKIDGMTVRELRKYIDQAIEAKIKRLRVDVMNLKNPPIEKPDTIIRFEEKKENKKWWQKIF